MNMNININTDTNKKAIVNKLNMDISPSDKFYIYRKYLDDGAMRIQVAYKKDGAERGVNITKEVATAFGLRLITDKAAGYGIMCAPWVLIQELCSNIDSLPFELNLI